MPQRTPLPSELGDAFTVAQAAALGVTRKRLTRPDLAHPFHGVRMRPAAGVPDAGLFASRRAELCARVRAYALVMPEEAFLCLGTAAVLHGYPLRLPAYAPIEVAVHHPGRAPRGRGVNGHAVRPSLAHVNAVDGIRVTSPATTWAMLGARLDLAELVAFGDAMVRVPRHPGGFRPPSGPPLATIEQLAAASVAGRRVGVDRLRQALPLVRTGSSSPAETKTRLMLVNGGLPEPQLDVDVYDAHGRWLGCSEIAYPAYRVAVEYEGTTTARRASSGTGTSRSTRPTPRRGGAWSG
ncbi:hypothetical protein [Microbacterium sp. zg-YB36]|uniref:hypothetical protein n=1 Tax=Microbacterium sp. zg-YB36 TaxID=2969407 RepID=UPI00214B9102|nr:hypothetical protein [Microbacterium sp. zg-YB36]MDL5352843.1 hypothetical protein [Microbacterium sp. zg-YB36]